MGTRFKDSDHTYTVSGTLHIPIWRSGRVGGDFEQAQAELNQRRTEPSLPLSGTDGEIANAPSSLSETNLL